MEILGNLPFKFYVYVILISGLMAASVCTYFREQQKSLLILIFAIISVGIAGTSGIDDLHHIARTIILADQVRNASIDLLFDSAIHGESLPIFLYYSAIPYAPSVLLNLTGIPASAAYKLTLIGYLGLFISGTFRLVASQIKHDRKTIALSVLLLVGANYIVSLWLIRSAMAEILSFSLVPWVTSALIMAPSSSLSLFLLLAMQAAIHPIVLLHSLLAEFAGAWALSRARLSDLIRNSILPFILAIIASSPFWLPAVIYRNAILGPKGLPLEFADTFLMLSDILHPLSRKTPGLILFAVTLLAAAKARGKREIILLSLFYLSLFIQTNHGKFIGLRLPFIDSSIFIWRLLFVTSFFGFTTFLLVGHTISKGVKIVLSLCSIVVISIFSIRAGIFSGFPSTSVDDRARLNFYFKSHRSWGIVEYFPNYSNLPNACPSIKGKTITTHLFASIRDNGIEVKDASMSDFIAIPRAPWGYITYRFDDEQLKPMGSCEDKLIFGPFADSGKFTVSSTRLNAILWLRIISTFAMVWGSILLGAHSVISRLRINTP